MSMSDTLEELKDSLRQTALRSAELSVPKGGTPVELPPLDEVVQSVLTAAESQRAARLSAVGLAPQWASIQKIRDGAAGASLLLDVIGLCAEVGIERLGVAGADLDNRAHALVDIWARVEATRALLMELFDQWPSGAPNERVRVLGDSVRQVSIESASRLLEGGFGSVALLQFIKDNANFSDF